MRILVTAGPTREYIDTVRFISNASSGRMGFAIATAATRAGHAVTLLAGAVSLTPPDGVTVVRFQSTADLKAELNEHFEHCDALVMAAAVGDFFIPNPPAKKLRRQDGAITLTLTPTEDILAGAAKRKRPDQVIAAFAIEDGGREDMQIKARNELARKGADFVVVNPPAAIASEESLACILSAERILLPWARRTKDELAMHIIAALEKGRKKEI